ncbi:MAG: cobalt-precorrin-5B (C(1))-methyltransferase CbiD [Synechococcus sp.]
MASEHVQGLTLPVWLAATARAALVALRREPFQQRQPLRLTEDATETLVPVASAAGLEAGEAAMAIGHCDPGPGLDLTRGLEIWVRVAWTSSTAERIVLSPGEGVGRLGADGAACLSPYADALLQRTLLPLLPAGRGIALEVVLPRGKALAERTSNAAFGVVDGLALIGMQAEVQRSAAPDQLAEVLAALEELCSADAFAGRLTLVIGENGLDLAREHGLTPQLKVGNWLGPVLVAAAENGVSELLLLGYHGKLVKLAGGIFHTHHHLADARLEVLTALGVRCGLTAPQLQRLVEAPSVEAAFQQLSREDSEAAQRLWSLLACTVEDRTQAYIARYGDWSIRIGAALFDRSRLIRWRGVGAERFFTLMD